MEAGLLVVERIVIESLSKREKNIFELSMDTGLGQRLLANILPMLAFKNIVRFSKGVYQLNEVERESWLPLINQKTQIKEEVKDLFTSLVNNYFDEEEKKQEVLKMQKVWLTKEEEQQFNRMLIDIESFIQNIRQNRKRRPRVEKTGEQKVIFWGCSSYSRLLDGVLSAV